MLPDKICSQLGGFLGKTLKVVWPSGASQSLCLLFEEACCVSWRHIWWCKENMYRDLSGCGKKTLCHDPLHRKALLWGQIPTVRQCHGYVANEVLVGPAPERLDLYMYIYIFVFYIFAQVCVVLLSRQQRQKQYAKTTSMWGWFIHVYTTHKTSDFKDGFTRFTRFFYCVNCVYHPFLVFF